MGSQAEEEAGIEKETPVSAGKIEYLVFSDFVLIIHSPEGHQNARLSGRPCSTATS